MISQPGRLRFGWISGDKFFIIAEGEVKAYVQEEAFSLFALKMNGWVPIIPWEVCFR